MNNFLAPSFRICCTNTKSVRNENGFLSKLCLLSKLLFLMENYYTTTYRPTTELDDTFSASTFILYFTLFIFIVVQYLNVRLGSWDI